MSAHATTTPESSPFANGCRHNSDAIATVAAATSECHDDAGMVKVMVTSENFQCGICQGYIIDATTICECLHSFCKSCILFYFESTSRKSKPIYRCPTCDIVLKDVRHGIKPDSLLQRLIYQLTPNLLKSELERRERFGTDADLSPCSLNGDAARGVDLISGAVLLNIRLEYAQTKRHRPVEIRSTALAEKGGSGFEMELLRMKRAPVRYLQVRADAPLQVLDKLIRSKYSLVHDCVIEFTHFGRLVLQNETFLEIYTSFNMKKNETLELSYEIKPTRQLQIETDYDSLKLHAVLDPAATSPPLSPRTNMAHTFSAKHAKQLKIDTSSGQKENGQMNGCIAEADIKRELIMTPVAVVTPQFDISTLTVDTLGRSVEDAGVTCSVSSSTDKRAAPKTNGQIAALNGNSSAHSPPSTEENFLTPPSADTNDDSDKTAPQQTSPSARPVNTDFLKVKFKKTQSVSPPAAAKVQNNGTRNSTESAKSASSQRKTPNPPAPTPPPPVPAIEVTPAEAPREESTPSSAPVEENGFVTAPRSPKSAGVDVGGGGGVEAPSSTTESQSAPARAASKSPEMAQLSPNINRSILIVSKSPPQTKRIIVPIRADSFKALKMASEASACETSATNGSDASPSRASNEETKDEPPPPPSTSTSAVETSSPAPE